MNESGHKPVRKWVLDAQKGDTRAFEELFNMFQGTVYNTALQLVGNPDDAEDITQEVFICAWEKLPKLNTPEAFRNWILTITVNFCRIHFRKERTHFEPKQEFLKHEENEEETIIDNTIDIEATVLQRDRAKLVRDAVSELPLSFREVVTLHYFEEMEVSDIAKILHLPIGTVKSRLARAREMLRNKLKCWL